MSFKNEPPARVRLIFNKDIVTQYATSRHCVYYHRYHIVWSTKYRYKVLIGDIRLRARELSRQGCGENGIEIVHGVLSQDHVHVFV